MMMMMMMSFDDIYSALGNQSVEISHPIKID
jgi:hypothetical protein